MMGHRISLRFRVNDVLMCFFIDLAVMGGRRPRLQAGRARRSGALQTR